MKLSLLFPETRSLDAVRELARDTEARGFHGMWLGSAFGFDPVMALALAGSATSRVSLGVAVIPSWPRHPLVAAQQAATANAACGGRFRLGVGPSHVPVMGMYGIDAQRPVSHSREYLDVARALLRTGRVDYQGERFRVQAFLDVEGSGIGEAGTAPPVLLAVLREQMARVAGGHADGALCWLTPASHLARVVAPAMDRGAHAVGRAERPPLVAELPCALSTDREAVHTMAARDLGLYPQMPYYRNMFEAAGVALDGRRWSDEMLDAAVVWGDAARIGDQVASLFAAGADEVVLSPFGVGDDPAASQAACIDVLSELARG